MSLLISSDAIKNSTWSKEDKEKMSVHSGIGQQIDGTGLGPKDTIHGRQKLAFSALTKFTL